MKDRCVDKTCAVNKICDGEIRGGSLRCRSEGRRNSRPNRSLFLELRIRSFAMKFRCGSSRSGRLPISSSLASAMPDDMRRITDADPRLYH